MAPDETSHATDPGNPRNKPSEFKLARQRSRHSAAEVSKVLDVHRSTISRWESGELDAPSDVVEWLQINRNQYASEVRPLFPKDVDGNPGKRGQDHRAAREAFVFPQTSVVAKAAEKTG